LPVIAATAALLFSLDAALAARMENLHARRNLDEINKQHGPTPATLNAQAKARRHAELLSVPADSTLAPLQETQKDKVGSYYRYQQLFQGVPVYGADLTLSEDPNGNLKSVFGQLAQGLSSDLTSTAANLSPQQAIAIAKRSVLTGENSNMPTEGEQAKMMIYIDDDGGAHVVYETSFFVAHPRAPTGPTFFIDANTGEILRQWDGLRR
jgi:Zn-dependent metalloprotease